MNEFGWIKEIEPSATSLLKVGDRVKFITDYRIMNRVVMSIDEVDIWLCSPDRSSARIIPLHIMDEHISNGDIKKRYEFNEKRHTWTYTSDIRKW